MKKWIAGTGAAIVAGITIAIFGLDTGAGDTEALIIATLGTKPNFQKGEVILVKEPGHPWGRCDNPQTQADIDYCAAKGTGLTYTVRTVDFITEAEAASINAQILRAKVVSVQNPTNLVIIP